MPMCTSCIHLWNPSALSWPEPPHASHKQPARYQVLYLGPKIARRAAYSANESMYLAGGLMVARLCSVIETLWAIADGDGVLAAKEIYRRLLKPTDDDRVAPLQSVVEDDHQSILGNHSESVIS
ncbi:hypothetical protein BD779DRAFT_1499306 [Infundibulicybe gibba]|nr:hypothetical protein BD779DRAFT_1499306 [Infundibulicybe gibba]